jgi:hypothetical protein
MTRILIATIALLLAIPVQAQDTYDRKDRKLQRDTKGGWCQVQGKWKC